MEQPDVKTIRKLIDAGQQAGFSVDQMIDLLEAGLSIATLIELIDWRLAPNTIAHRSSRWIT